VQFFLKRSTGAVFLKKLMLVILCSIFFSNDIESTKAWFKASQAMAIIPFELDESTE